MTRLVPTLFLAATAIFAQSPITNSITGEGTATIRVTPDQAQFTVSVITQATTAQEASQQNSALATTVINALKSAVGAAGTVQTVDYSVSPRYNNTGNIIIGYTASNTVQVTSNDISNIGRLIDTANQAGASSIGAISFGLQDPEPAKQQALSKAAQVALAHASAVAAGISRKTGAVILANEGSSYAPVVAGDRSGLAAAAPTPIQTGQVSVYATVTVVVAIQ
jgi:uncharacterized protein YggE